MEWIFIRIASPDSSLPLKNVLPWTGAVSAIFRARSAPDKGKVKSEIVCVEGGERGEKGSRM